MGRDVGQIFPTASLHRDHSISYALVCEKELSHMGKNDGVREHSLSLQIYQIWFDFDMILYLPSTIFQLCKDRSSWVETVLS